jgi:hypothetical protein
MKATLDEVAFDFQLEGKKQACRLLEGTEYFDAKACN